MMHSCHAYLAGACSTLVRDPSCPGIHADEPVELPKFDVTWLEIGDEYKLMHVKVMSPAELALPADVQVCMCCQNSPSAAAM